MLSLLVAVHEQTWVILAASEIAAGQAQKVKGLLKYGIKITGRRATATLRIVSDKGGTATRVIKLN